MLNIQNLAHVCRGTIRVLNGLSFEKVRGTFSWRIRKVLEMRPIDGFLLLLAVILLSAPSARAQEVNSAAQKSLRELDTRLDDAFKRAHVPGAAFVLIENNKVAWKKNYGVRDVALKLPVTDQTIFRAGSVTKSLTSLLAMTYVAEGKLDLNAKLANVAPDIGFDNPWENTAPVRIVNLIEHTTGWPDLEFSDVSKLTPLDTVDGDLVNTRRLRVSRWQPGRYMAYTSIGPGIAGVLLQRIGGAPYAKLMHDRVFGPLGMSSAELALTPAIRPLLSKSYDADGTTEIAYHGLGFSAAGSLLTTASDLAKFSIFMNSRGITEGGKQLITPDAVRRMEHPTSTLAAKAGLALGYGLGVYYAPQSNFVVFGHNGGIDGFESNYVYWQATGKGYVLLTNGGDGADAALEVVSEYLGRNYKSPAAPEIALDPAAIAPYAGYYRALASRHPFLDALTSLYPEQMDIEKSGRINVFGVEHIHSGSLQFHRGDRAESTLIFYQTPEGDREMSTGRQVYRKLATSELVAHGAVIVGTAIAALATVLLLLIRLVRLFLKRREHTPGIGSATMRWAPALAVIVLGAMSGAFLFAANAGYQAVEILGRPDGVTYGIYFASLLWPALALLGLVAAVFAPAQQGRFARATAFAISVPMCGLAIYCLLYGWVGIRFWS